MAALGSAEGGGVVVLSNGYQEPFGRNVQSLAHRIVARHFEE